MIRMASLVGLVILAGCVSPPPPAAFSLPMDAARARARESGRPLLILSVVGDLDGRL